MINKCQLKELIKTTLIEYSLYSKEAFELVYGTIIQESKRGYYLRQVPKGEFNMNIHAIGIGQMEKATFLNLQRIFLSKYPEIKNIRFEELEYNLKYSILFCRLRYLIDPEPIPKDLQNQAKYYKRVYNTKYGSATPEQYIENYNKYN